MMGFQGTPARLFYDFWLEEHVPVDHMLRGIDRHLALDDLRQSLKPFYSQMGGASVDPELMIRMLIVGYCMGIRSERRLCDEVHLNLAYRWFCGLGLDETLFPVEPRRPERGGKGCRRVRPSNARQTLAGSFVRGQRTGRTLDLA